MEDTANQHKKELFRKLIDDKGPALKAIYDHYYPRLKIHVRYFIRYDEVMVEDVVEDVFIVLWENRDDVAKKENPEAWLMAIAKNQALNAIKRRKKQHAEPLEDHLDMADATAADSELAGKELNELIEKAVGGLTLAEQEVLALKRVEGLTDVEIAEKLGKSRQTVKNQLSKALKKLRKLMDTLKVLILI